MPAVFASEDVAQLVSTFPPPRVANRPTLVLSNSGPSLIKFETVLSRFQDILDNGKSRIWRGELGSKLGARLNAEEERIMMGLVQDDILFNLGNEYIVPRPIAQELLTNIESSAKEECVDLVAFAIANDLQLHGLELRIDSDLLLENFRSRDLESNRVSFVFSTKVTQELKESISKLLAAADSDICDLDTFPLSSYPPPLVEKSAVNIASDFGGEVTREGERLLYIPREYAATQRRRVDEAAQDQVAELVGYLEQKGFCEISFSKERKYLKSTNCSIETQIRKAYESTHTSNFDLIALTNIDKDGLSLKSSKVLVSGTKIMVLPNVFNEQHRRMMEAIDLHIESEWAKCGRDADVSVMVQNLQENNLDDLHQRRLATLVLHSERGEEFVIVAQTKILNLEQEEDHKFVQLMNSTIIAPFQLYARGISNIQDKTLKQHVEIHVLHYFQGSILGRNLTRVSSECRLEEKSTKEVQKFQQTYHEMTTFPGLQAEIAKFTKKLRLPPPSDMVLRDTKIRLLNQALETQVLRGTSASDVLQNIIWISLALELDGLFMGSGRDTSRMIEQYKAVGDAEMAQNLATWRDIIKKSQSSEDLLREMRTIAVRLMANEAAALMTAKHGHNDLLRITNGT